MFLWAPFCSLNIAWVSWACQHFPMSKLWPHRPDTFSAQGLGLEQERGVEAFGNKWVTVVVRCEIEFRKVVVAEHAGTSYIQSNGVRRETSGSLSLDLLTGILPHTCCSNSINPHLQLWVELTQSLQLFYSLTTFSVAWFLHSILSQKHNFHMGELLLCSTLLFALLMQLSATHPGETERYAELEKQICIFFLLLRWQYL